MMGEHKNNKTAIAAKNGEISPKKKTMSKRQQEWLIKAMIVERCGLAPIFAKMGIDKELTK